MNKKNWYLFILLNLLLGFWFYFGVSAQDISNSYPKELLKKYNSVPKNQYRKLLEKGNSCLNKNQLYDAIDYFTQAKKLIPQNPDAYINLAAGYLSLGNSTRATKLLNEAQKLNLENYSEKYLLFYNLGIAAHTQKNYKEAIKYYFKAIELNPSFTQAWQALEKSSKYAGKVINSSSNFEVYQEDYSFLNLPNASQSQAQQNSIQITKATKSFTKPKTIEEDSDPQTNAKKLLQKGSIAFKEGDTQKAISLINQSIDFNPKNPHSYYRLGTIYASIDNFTQARKFFEKAIKYNPRFIKAYINLGSSWGKLKKYKKALSVLLKAAKLDDKNPKLYYNISMAYLALGHIDEATRYLQKAKNLCSKEDTKLLKRIRDMSKKIRG